MAEPISKRFLVHVPELKNVHLVPLDTLSSQIQETYSYTLIEHAYKENIAIKSVTVDHSVIRSSRFFSASMEKCSISDTKITDSDLSALQSNDCFFERVLIEGVKFMGSFQINNQYNHVQFSHCNFSSSSIHGSQNKQVEFRHCDFSSSKLGGIDFKNTRFTDCNFTGCEFMNVKLNGVDLRGNQLSHLSITPKDLYGATVSPDQAIILASYFGLHVE